MWLPSGFVFNKDIALPRLPFNVSVGNTVADHMLDDNHVVRQGIDGAVGLPMANWKYEVHDCIAVVQNILASHYAHFLSETLVRGLHQKCWPHYNAGRAIMLAVL